MTSHCLIPVSSYCQPDVSSFIFTAAFCFHYRFPVNFIPLPGTPILISIFISSSRLTLSNVFSQSTKRTYTSFYTPIILHLLNPAISVLILFLIMMLITIKSLLSDGTCYWWFGIYYIPKFLGSLSWLRILIHTFVLLTLLYCRSCWLSTSYFHTTII